MTPSALAVCKWRQEEEVVHDGSGIAVASLPHRPDLAASAKDGAEVGREAEQKLEDVAGAVVGVGHGGQHQAPGQQGDMAGGIDIVLD